MPVHKCDTCGRSYGYKRNLKRHMTEKHADIEHWNCVEVKCAKTFTRRSSLSHHLFTVHGYTSLGAREFALRALRGDVHDESYYEDISDDDTVFDLINEIEEIREIRGADESVMDFDLDYLDDISLGIGEERKCDSVENSEVVTGDNAENGVVKDDEVRTNSINLDDDMNSEGLMGDDKTEKTEVVTNDENIINSEVNDSVDAVGNITTATCETEYSMINVPDTESYLNDGQGISDISAVDSGDGFETGDDWKCDFSDDNVSDMSDSSDNSNDGSSVGIADEDNMIIISSDDGDEFAGTVERSQIQTRTQRFILTFTRKLEYLNGHVVNTVLTMERDYFEHNN